MGVKAVAGLIIRRRGLVVVDHPMGTAHTAYAVFQSALPVFLPVPEAANATAARIGVAARGIGMAVRAERQHHLIAMPRAAFGKFRAAGQIQGDAPERCEG